jgi:hypothetical protein
VTVRTEASVKVGLVKERFRRLRGSAGEPFVEAA